MEWLNRTWRRLDSPCPYTGFIERGVGISLLRSIFPVCVWGGGGLSSPSLQLASLRQTSRNSWDPDTTASCWLLHTLQPSSRHRVEIYSYSTLLLNTARKGGLWFLWRVTLITRQQHNSTCIVRQCHQVDRKPTHEEMISKSVTLREVFRIMHGISSTPCLEA